MTDEIDFVAAVNLARDELARSERDIARLLGPKRGVAFVGSAEISEAARYQFARYGQVRICIVNPKGGQAGDLPIFRSVLEVPDEIDLVVVRVPARHAKQVIEDCGRRGIRDILVFSDGFAETGSEGLELEKTLAEAVRGAGVRVLGPNTNDNAFEQYPTPPNHRGKSIALMTQSGANGRSVVARWVTTGNEIDLEVSDFIHYFVQQPEVGVLALYVEGFKSSAKLRLALERAILAGKPLVAIKMGATERGARTAASHTGHLAGSNTVVNGLFQQYGVTRVDDVDELLETANLFAKLPVGTGPRCAMYTISGGTAALMAEMAAMNGVAMPELGQELQDALHAHIPRNLNVANPIDNGGVFIMRAPQAERLAVLDLIAADPKIDVIVFGLNAAYGPLSDRMGADILAWAPTAPKPVVAVWTSVVVDTAGYADLVASGVPIFRSFKKCMRALRAYADFGARKQRFQPKTVGPRPLTTAQRRALRGDGVLTGADAMALLAGTGITFPRERLVTSLEEVPTAATQIGFPLVVKLISPDIPHKSDLGLVRIGIRSAEEALAVARELVERVRSQAAHAHIEGVLVQEQIDDGIEMIVGLSHDSQLGPTLTLGAGGIHAEILRDVAVAPLPVNEVDVREMISSLRLAPLLRGARGRPPADIDGLVNLALNVAALAQAAGSRLRELDLNPVLVQPHRVVAVDSLVVVANRSGTPRHESDPTVERPPK
jgi:acyl-CoA synthetase (NDP forming)